MGNDIPLGPAGVVGTLPSIAQDKGDDTQERFRYQAAIGVMLLARALKHQDLAAIWCEHHDDFLLQKIDGSFVAVQVKTDSNEGSQWRLSHDALIGSVARFCKLESKQGEAISAYVFASNTACYIPATSVMKDETLASSPARLMDACKSAAGKTQLPDPYRSSFEKLAAAAKAQDSVLLHVLQKMEFHLGPTLRDYDAVLASNVVPDLPDCQALSALKSRLLRDQLIAKVQDACRLKKNGIDGALSYIQTNGQPEAILRNKCITVAAFSAVIGEAKSPSFRFVDCGLTQSMVNSNQRTEALGKKLAKAFVGGQFESLLYRMHGAESRLIERAHTHPEEYDQFSAQLQGAVLTTCKDAEASAYNIASAVEKGPYVYNAVLQKLEHLALSKPHLVYDEPLDTLMGVAGMLSGECKFAWGIPLEASDDGA